MTARGLATAVALAIAVVVAGVLVFWPAPATGPEPLRYGRDTCAGCRMTIGRPGFGGEMRDHAGRLTTYDDVGCLLRAMVATHREVPEAWVEDHDGGGLVPLVTAHFVRADGAETPMGYDILAFKDADAASRYAAAHAGRQLALEDVLHDADTLLATPRHPGAAGEGGRR